MNERVQLVGLTGDKDHALSLDVAVAQTEHERAGLRLEVASEPGAEAERRAAFGPSCSNTDVVPPAPSFIEPLLTERLTRLQPPGPPPGG